MVVVDTNILAYLLIKGDRTADAQALFTRDAEWRSEGFVLIEFSNILATYQRSGALSRSAAETMLATAERVVTGFVNLPHGRALKLAAEFGVSAYDARFPWGRPKPWSQAGHRGCKAAHSGARAHALACGGTFRMSRPPRPRCASAPDGWSTSPLDFSLSPPGSPRSAATPPKARGAPRPEPRPEVPPSPARCTRRRGD